jgi:hypothetical protein
MKKEILSSKAACWLFGFASLAGLQAYAQTTWQTGDIIPSGGAQEIFNTPYQGSISFSSLVTGSTPYAGQTLTSGTLDVEISGDTKHDPVYAWVGPYSLTFTAAGIASQTPSSGAGTWLDFTLDSAELAYIDNPNDPIKFQAEADCKLQQYSLTVTGPTTGHGSGNVPDGASTMFLLGGVLTTLGLIKRKMA